MTGRFYRIKKSLSLTETFLELFWRQLNTAETVVECAERVADDRAKNH